MGRRVATGRAVLSGMSVLLAVLVVSGGVSAATLAPGIGAAGSIDTPDVAEPGAPSAIHDPGAPSAIHDPGAQSGVQSERRSRGPVPRHVRTATRDPDGLTTTPPEPDCDERTTLGGGTDGVTAVPAGETTTFRTTVEGDCGVRIRLETPGVPDPGTDLDLYVTLDGRTPTSDDYDRRSTGAGTDESIALDPEPLAEGTTIGVTVSAYTGTANVSVVVEAIDPDPGDRVRVGRERSHDTTVVWRGFRHVWSYNHRVSRVGSWVDTRSCNATGCSYAVGHSGATGSGADRASFRDAYTELSARGVGFESGTVEFDVRGTERLSGPRSQVVEGSRLVSVPANGTLAGSGEHVALINGFDLVAEGVPMKFVSLDVHATTPRVEDGRIRFRVNYRTLLDCDSVECPGWFGKRPSDVDYTLRVQYLLVGGPRGLLNVAPAGSVSESYDWDRCKDNPPLPTLWFSTQDRHDRGVDQTPNSVFPGNHMNCENSEGRELDHGNYVTNRTVPTQRGYGVSVPGIRGFSLDLDEEIHYTQYDTVVGGSNDRSAGGYDLRTLTFLKEWSARPGQNDDAWGEYGHRGSATVSVDPVVIQVETGCKRSFVHGGGIAFDTDRKDVTAPSQSAAVVGSEHSFRYGTGWPPVVSGTGGCRRGTLPSQTVNPQAFWVDVWNERLRDVSPGEAKFEDPTRLRYEHTSRFYNRSG